MKTFFRKNWGKITLVVICAVLIILGFINPPTQEPLYPFADMSFDNSSYAAVFYYYDEYELSPEERENLLPPLRELAVYGEEEAEAPAGMNTGLSIQTDSEEYTVSVSGDRVYINGAEYKADTASARELSDMIRELVEKYYTE